jgi:4-alpha-glucanotransferase
VPSPTLADRASGVLLHPTSLPGPYGSGDLGPQARAFIDWLGAAGMRWWQMLPVGPVGFGNSPYSSLSAFAGSPLLVSLEELANDGLLDDLPARTSLPEARVDYEATTAFHERELRRAFGAFMKRGDGARALDRFRAEHESWLPDFALFSALKRAHGGGAFIGWPKPLIRRDAGALAQASTELTDDIRFHEFCQYEFDRQWQKLRAYGESKGIGLIGDIPIFVAHDSADVWSRPELFKLDADGNPTVVSGVPPDYFSATGQRWGNPLYRWDDLKRRGYDWWIDRVRSALGRFHAIRLDHFIGFQRYWEIPADCPTAVDGKWLPGPSADLFQALERALGKLPLIAEDLGAVTPEVTALRDQFGLPGIRILQFAFGTDPQAPNFKPHNYPRNAVAYTGTHDNDTANGWFNDPGGKGSTRTPEETANERALWLAYLGKEGQSTRDAHWDMVRVLLTSVADLTVFPMQDLLGLGSDARMNLPGTAEGNWSWRVTREQLSPALAQRLQTLNRIYER